MALDAGSVKGKIELEGGAQFNSTLDSSIGKTKGLTGSMFKAQVAFALVQKAVQAVTGFVKDSIGAWNAQEQAIAITRATLKSTGNAIGMTVKELVDLSGQVQQATTFADENVLAAQNMLLTYTKIGKDIFPRTTMAIADMSSRIGDLNGNARLVGRALEDPVRGLTMLQRMGVTFSETQKEQIVNFAQTNQLGKAQALILTELEKKFGGSAAAIRNTFGGAVTALKNTWGDFQENIGQYASAVGRPLVENLNRTVQAINKWLTSAEGMEIVSDILSNIAAGFEVLKQVVKPIIDAIGPALEGIFNQIKDSFTELVGEGEEGNAVFTALAVVSKTVALALTIVGKVIQFTIQTTGNLINAVKLSIQTLAAYGDALNHLGDPRYAKRAEATAAAAGKAWEKFVVDQKDGIVDIVETGVNGVMDIIRTADAEGARLAKQFKDTQEARKKDILDYLKGTTEEYGRAMVARAEAERKAGQNTDKAADAVVKTWKESVQEIESAFSGFAGFFQGIQNQILSIWNQSLTNQQTALDNDYATRRENIEANVQDEEERNRQLAALEEEHAAATAEIQKKQWAAQQAAAVTGAIMSGAQAIMQGFAQLGPIGGAIAAAAIGTLTAIEVGLILSQPMPEFAEGGIAGPGLALVGERGPEVVQFDRTARVYSNEESREMFGASGPVQNNYFGDVHNDTDTDRASAIIAAQYRAMLRGAA